MSKPPKQRSEPNPSTASRWRVLAGLAVLLGAIAAARAARTYDTVVLRVLGADRRQILVPSLVSDRAGAEAPPVVSVDLVHPDQPQAEPEEAP